MQLYKGDISSKIAWEMLKNNPASYLVDVRTEAEWNYVGFPDLNQIGKQPLFIEWLTLPDMKKNSNFTAQLSQKIANKNSDVIFICRTGGRSGQAANEMTELGYLNCYNVENGFEGALDVNHQRGNINGWKADLLPWRQS